MVESPYTPDDVPSDAWERRHEPEIRELIVLAYWPLLTRVVGRMRQGMPQHLDEEDLRSYALSGLYRAMDRFDQDKGFDFSVFASNHIRGALLDELRAMDWAPRSLRERQRALAKATSRLMHQLHRDPEEIELAEHLGWTTSDVVETRRQVDVAFPRSLDALHATTEQDLYAVIADAYGTPEELVLDSAPSHGDDSAREVSLHMSHYFASLDPEQKVILAWVYYQGKPVSSVADVIGMSVDQAKAMHKSMILEIRDRLNVMLDNSD